MLLRQGIIVYYKIVDLSLISFKRHPVRFLTSEHPEPFFLIPSLIGTAPTGTRVLVYMLLSSRNVLVKYG